MKLDNGSSTAPKLYGHHFECKPECHAKGHFKPLKEFKLALAIADVLVVSYNVPTGIYRPSNARRNINISDSRLRRRLAFKERLAFPLETLDSIR